MKILFVMRHSGYVRNFESTLRLLCDRGHTVLLGFQVGGTHWLLDPDDVTRDMAQQYPRFSRDMIPVRDDAWGHVARELRLGLDYLRYLRPEYRGAPKLRERAAREVPAGLIERSTKGPWSSDTGRAVMAGAYRRLLRTLPTDAYIDAFLEANKPDVLAVTPLIEPGAPQAEYLRSARALGIRTALCVASWDNLTNKGLIHGHVDLVTVWNAAMRREAIELHGVAPERVVVTGAQAFDHWFGWQPSRTRELFLAQVGLPAHRPYVLYLCSSRFIAPNEVPFVRRWLQELRASASPLLRDLGVLIRPHPQNADQWHDVDLHEYGPVVVWPRAGAPPSTDRHRADYFDSIFHSAGVIGINTTAEIESAIVGRSVFTVLDADFKDTQDGTLHFEHLRKVNGGLLHAAATLPEHAAQLEAALRNPAAGDERCRKFVEAFVRPHGFDTAATPRLADALEMLSRQPVTPPEPMPAWAPLGRALLASRGRRLQREALILRETKAAKLRKQKKKEKAAQAAPQESAAGAPR
jgi:hypothetical protein